MNYIFHIFLFSLVNVFFWMHFKETCGGSLTYAQSHAVCYVVEKDVGVSKSKNYSVRNRGY